MDKDKQSAVKVIAFPCIKVCQPIGEFYIASMDCGDLCEITYSDIRRIEHEKDRPFERYLGIERPLDQRRVVQLKKYVQTVDATFPTSVIIAVDENCAKYDDAKKEMVLSNDLEATGKPEIPIDRIGQVLDGQHRLAGLKNYEGTPFHINVSIFIGADLATQANVFSTVNLAQTKVSKSLVYDLFDVAKARSPQKTCHVIAVALDKHETSPFSGQIKRLGIATDGRFNETITQATFVEALLRYISKSPMEDRDIYLRGGTPRLASAEELQKLIFRNMFIENRDLEIADVVFNYFAAVRTRWPRAWGDMGTGNMLNKTNGFRALMRFLGPAYRHVAGFGEVPTEADFTKKVFQFMRLEDDDFTIDNYKPGTSGEAKLFRDLRSQSVVHD